MSLRTLDLDGVDREKLHELDRLFNDGYDRVLMAWRNIHEAIDNDIALLIMAGISITQMELHTYCGDDDKRQLVVDGKPVREYRIRYVVDGESLAK